MTDDLARRLQRLLHGRPRRSFADSAYRPAAVLVPFIPHPDGWRVLFIRRAAQLNHGGQMAFPGGSVDAGDRDPVHTALRETREELGVEPAHVRVFGAFDDFAPTSSGFYATPVVAALPCDYPYRPNPAEVETVVEVPFDFLSDPANLRIEPRRKRPFSRQNYSWNYGPYTIWGFTSRIFKGLLDALYPEP